MSKLEASRRSIENTMAGDYMKGRSSEAIFTTSLSNQLLAWYQPSLKNPVYFLIITYPLRLYYQYANQFL